MQASSGNAASAPGRNLTKLELVLLLLAFLLPGLAGHDPWKPDEGYFFGMVHSLLQGSDWVVPTLAGEPFMEKPPLIMWLGALTAKLAEPLLPPHDGARLSIALCMALTLAAVGAIGRRAHGVGGGRLASLALLGSLGILLSGHMLIADVPLMMGFAIGLLGFALILQRPLVGGVLLGTGVGIGFLAKGLLAPGVFGVAAVLLPLLSSQWRTRHYARGLGTAFLSSLPWLIIWPALLYRHSPALFAEWFWQNNIGRYLGFSVAKLGAANEGGYWRNTLPWFTFPLLPLAAWSLWQDRRALLQRRLAPALEACLLVAVVGMAVLISSASARAIYSLILLPPLAVLAVGSLSRLSERMNRSVDWAIRLIGLAACLFLWYGWAYALSYHAAPPWLVLLTHLPADQPFAGVGIGMVAALLLAALWVALLFRLPQLRARGLISWVAALTLLWGTAASLWFPWVDAGKSYRATFLQMQAALPAKFNCMASHQLGESERGILDYLTGIRTIRHEVLVDNGCDYVLAQSVAGETPWWGLHGWKTLWSGARPGDQRERFWLYQQPAAVSPVIP